MAIDVEPHSGFFYRSHLFFYHRVAPGVIIVQLLRSYYIDVHEITESDNPDKRQGLNVNDPAGSAGYEWWPALSLEPTPNGVERQ